MKHLIEILDMTSATDTAPLSALWLATSPLPDWEHNDG